MERSSQLAEGPARQASGRFWSRPQRQNRLHAARGNRNQLHRPCDRPQMPNESPQSLRTRAAIIQLVGKHRRQCSYFSATAASGLCSSSITVPYSLFRISNRSPARVTYRTRMSIPLAAGRISTDGVAENCLRSRDRAAPFHSASASFASSVVCSTTALWIASIVLYVPSPAGTFTLISSHIHCPAVEKLKNCPVTAKLFMNITRRPVGCPLSVQFPVSSSAVRNSPSSATSPPTPLISTQSPTRIPFFPISTNHPKNARMKS